MQRFSTRGLRGAPGHARHPLNQGDLPGGQFCLTAGRSARPQRQRHPSQADRRARGAGSLLAEGDVAASVARPQPARLQRVERSAGGGPGHFSSQPGVAQGAHRGGVGGARGGLHHQDLQGLPLSRRGRHRRRGRLHRVSGWRKDVACCSQSLFQPVF